MKTTIPDGEIEDAETLSELLDHLKQHGDALTDRELTRLPTYGGQEPASTEGLWSWDETHILIGTCIEDMEIVSRDWLEA